VPRSTAHATSAPGPCWRSLGPRPQSGFELDQRTATVVDHFHPAPMAKADHTVIETTVVADAPVIFPEPITKPIIYSGAGGRRWHRPQGR